MARKKTVETITGNGEIITEQVDDRPETEQSLGSPLETEIATDTINCAAETLTGDITTFILDRLRHMQKPWEQMTEDEQDAAIWMVKNHAEYLVRTACNIMAAAGRETAIASLETFKQKGGDVTAQLELIASPQIITALSNACGSRVQIVFLQQSHFFGERKPETPAPDQGGLDLPPFEDCSVGDAD